MSTEVQNAGSGVPGRSRWMKPALIASLAFNLLVVGGVASAVWRHHHGHGRFGSSRGEISLMDFVDGLPADRQGALRQEIVSAREAVKPLRQEIKDAWTASNSVLTVEPFDKEKAKAVSQRLIDAEAKFKAAVANALWDTAEKLTPEERRELQQWREKRRGGLLRRWSKRWRDNPPPDAPPNASPE